MISHHVDLGRVKVFRELSNGLQVWVEVKGKRHLVNKYDLSLNSRPVLLKGSLDEFIGYLRRVRTVLRIRCPEAHVSKAKALYCEVTGRECTEDMLDVSGSSGTWSNMYYVSFPMPLSDVEIPTFKSQSKLSENESIKPKVTGNNVELCSRELLVYLLEHGFELGVNG